MDKTTMEVRHERWAAVVKECQSRPRDQTITQWCRERGISPKTYYYWQQRLRLETYNQMKQTALPTVSDNTEVAFAELLVQQYTGQEPAGENTFHPDAVIQSGKFTISLSNSASKPLISKILEAASRVS